MPLWVARWFLVIETTAHKGVGVRIVNLKGHGKRRSAQNTYRNVFRITVRASKCSLYSMRLKRGVMGFSAEVS